MVISVHVLRFSLKLLSRISEKVIKECFLDGKEDKFRKISNFKIFEKISFIVDKFGGNYVLSANSIKNMLIRVFLHAEFISAMKTVQNPTIFVKNAEK